MKPKAPSAQRERLEQYFESTEWRDVAKPLLLRKRAKLAHRMATTKYANLEALQADQAAYKLMGQMAEDMAAFLALGEDE